MKNIKLIGKIALIIILCFSVINVHASNYKMKELIPIDTETTIRGENFLYKGIKYSNGKIIFKSIKNLSSEKKSLTISIGLFDKNKRNLSIINYCNTTDALESKTSINNYVIKVDTDSLKEGTTLKDIKYISVLGENKNCRLGGAKEFVGERVENISQLKDSSISSSAQLLINIIKFIVVALIVIFIYRFLFTNRYRNINGDDVRQEYAYINKKLKQQREVKAKASPPKPKTVKKSKPDKVINQELSENSKSKDNSNLHNFYK